MRRALVLLWYRSLFFVTRVTRIAARAAGREVAQPTDTGCRVACLAAGRSARARERGGAVHGSATCCGLTSGACFRY
eukprot:scaffold439_cov415-Prasinococcus_capsulatus_cf.AAC.7